MLFIVPDFSYKIDRDPNEIALNPFNDACQPTIRLRHG